MDSITILIGVIVLLCIIILTFTIVVYMFFRRHTTTWIVIYPDGTMIGKRTRKTLSKLTIDKGVYVYDDSCVLKNFWGKKIYFYYNNPNPIHFDTTKNVPQTKSQDLQTFLNSNLVEQLFASENIQKLILILVVVALVMVGIDIATGFFGQKAVELSNSGNTTQIIKDACSQAIRGI